VTRNTRFERIAGFSGLRAGLRNIEATVRRSNGTWVAVEVERSAEVAITAAAAVAEDQTMTTRSGRPERAGSIDVPGRRRSRRGESWLRLRQSQGRLQPSPGPSYAARPGSELRAVSAYAAASPTAELPATAPPLEPSTSQSEMRHKRCDRDVRDGSWYPSAA
jgi:hypothetical protein